MFPAQFVPARTKLATLFLVGLTSALSAVLISCANSPQSASGSADMPFVAVTQIVERPSLNAVRDGIQDALAAAGYQVDETLRWEWQSAQLNPATAARIANKYAKARPDVIVAIAPHSAKATVAAAKNTPVIFCAVADPVAAGLVKSIDKPGDNVTGVSDRFPIDQQISLIKEILPDAQTLGVIYTAREEKTEEERAGEETGKTVSASSIALIRESAPEQGFISVREVAVFTSGEVADAARSLVGSVDAIYVATEVTTEPTTSELESVVQVGKDNFVPVFSGSMNAVERGAIAGVSFDYYDVGRQAGEMVIKVLKGSKPGDLPVEFIEAVQLSVNPTAAAAMGVVLPEAVTASADSVIEPPLQDEQQP
ncbi:MAG: ABC transporter substrate-binding protein [Phormidesmis sp.]